MFLYFSFLISTIFAVLSRQETDKNVAQTLRFISLIIWIIAIGYTFPKHVHYIDCVTHNEYCK